MNEWSPAGAQDSFARPTYQPGRPSSRFDILPTAVSPEPVQQQHVPPPTEYPERPSTSALEQAQIDAAIQESIEQESLSRSPAVGSPDNTSLLEQTQIEAAIAQSLAEQDALAREKLVMQRKLRHLGLTEHGAASAVCPDL